MYQKVLKIQFLHRTALIIHQIRLIRRLTQNIVVLFDGDSAGQKAAIRGIDLILQEGMNVRVCFFPNEKILIVIPELINQKR